MKFADIITAMLEGYDPSDALTHILENTEDETDPDPEDSFNNAVDKFKTSFSKLEMTKLGNLKSTVQTFQKAIESWISKNDRSRESLDKGWKFCSQLMYHLGKIDKRDRSKYGSGFNSFASAVYSLRDSIGDLIEVKIREEKQSRKKRKAN